MKEDLLKKEKSEPENGYRKPNNCPYCGYFCDAAMMTGNDKAVPKTGDLSFCMMCCEPSVFDESMKMQKFDLNSVNNLVERNRLKGIKIKMELFWETHPEDSPRQEQFLKVRDQQEQMPDVCKKCGGHKEYYVKIGILDRPVLIECEECQ